MTVRSNLEILLDKTISFDRAMNIIADRQLRKGTQSTVDAVIYSLHSGVGALARSDVQERLGRIDEKQLREICSRVTHIAKPWTADDVEKLVAIWVARHG
jgi:citrate lyase beta subunit